MCGSDKEGKTRVWEMEGVEGAIIDNGGKDTPVQSLRLQIQDVGDLSRIRPQLRKWSTK